MKTLYSNGFAKHQQEACVYEYELHMNMKEWLQDESERRLQQAKTKAGQASKSKLQEH